jgi:hypothetical protein
MRAIHCYRNTDKFEDFVRERFMVSNIPSQIRLSVNVYNYIQRHIDRLIIIQLKLSRNIRRFLHVYICTNVHTYIVFFHIGPNSPSCMYMCVYSV